MIYDNKRYNYNPDTKVRSLYELYKVVEKTFIGVNHYQLDQIKQMCRNGLPRHIDTPTWERDTAKEMPEYINLPENHIAVLWTEWGEASIHHHSLAPRDFHVRLVIVGYNPNGIGIRWMLYERPISKASWYPRANAFSRLK